MRAGENTDASEIGPETPLEDGKMIADENAINDHN